MEAALSKTQELPELHAHLTSSVSPQVYWHIAHSDGYKLPKKDYWEFVDYMTLSFKKKETLKQYLDRVWHPLLNKLSSGTSAVEKSTYESIGGAYRSNNITLIEIRMNPMKHNHEGSVDLDHIILAMLRGMERALLEYKKVRAGIIFCMDRQFPVKQNAVIIEKAIKYHHRGVIGIDFANYDTGKFHFKDYIKLIEKAKDTGLKVTAHSGETDDTNDMWEAITYIQPHRIGHGIKAAYDKKLMKELAKKDITLEVCPISNLVTKAVKDVKELKFILQTLWDNNVKFCINTDWPELMEYGHLRQQINFLLENNILTQEQVDQTIRWGFESTFINSLQKNDNLYL